MQVLCKDCDVTHDNYLPMFRCDCKGYYKVFQCSHTYALAHWCARTMLPVSHTPVRCSCRWGNLENGERLLDLDAACQVMVAHAKPGRQKQTAAALQQQPAEGPHIQLPQVCAT